MMIRIAISSILLLATVMVGILFFKNSNPPKSTDYSEKQPQDVQEQKNQQLTIDGVHYLLDVSDQNSNEIKSLLDRAEQVSTESKNNTQASRIVMVIHGPNVELFDKKNYSKNKALIEQAARLDKTNVIDFIICKSAATAFGINTTSFPDFLEVVPFFGAEINRLEKQGYVEL